MFAVEQLTNEKFFWAYILKVFMPPVRDTLRIVKDSGKGKEPVDNAANASASENAPKVKEARIEIPREQNPSLYEICIRMQLTLKDTSRWIEKKMSN